MTRPLRAAVVGVGSMGRNHARVYSELEGVDLVGLADPYPAAAATIARRYKVPLYDTIVGLLEDATPDLVSVAVPTSQHDEAALACIARGAHVLVEKPIAATVEQGERMRDAAQRQGVLLSVGHIERFNPAVRALKAQLEQDALGRVFQVMARRIGPFPTRISDVGVVIDLATHDLDVMRYLLGSEIASVQAQVSQRLHTAHEDMVSALLRFESGPVGALDINWLTPTKVRELTITGQRGMFHVNYLTQELTFYENRLTTGGWDALSVLRGVGEGNATRLSIERKEPLLGELEAFVQAVRTGGAAPVTPEDGLAALAVAQSVLESGHTGETVWLKGYV